eukprot:TRINITY_DN43738_c0_g1_i1.p1 TRINITY_DN43738_c0_g1~~TRINITY_DN43738_c0_g1_i1.p1  ORF type:complete len:1046 (+),score=196.44 TRINITY_DN43738_c0_g1_i1:153-3290(+)
MDQEYGDYGGYDDHQGGWQQQQQGQDGGGVWDVPLDDDDPSFFQEADPGDLQRAAQAAAYAYMPPPEAKPTGGDGFEGDFDQEPEWDAGQVDYQQEPAWDEPMADDGYGGQEGTDQHNDGNWDIPQDDEAASYYDPMLPRGQQGDDTVIDDYGQQAQTYGASMGMDDYNSGERSRDRSGPNSPSLPGGNPNFSPPVSPTYSQDVGGWSQQVSQQQSVPQQQQQGVYGGGVGEFDYNTDPWTGQANPQQQYDYVDPSGIGIDIDDQQALRGRQGDNTTARANLARNITATSQSSGRLKRWETMDFTGPDIVDPHFEEPEATLCGKILYNIVAFFFIWMDPAGFDINNDGRFDERDVDRWIADNLPIKTPRKVIMKEREMRPMLVDLVRQQRLIAQQKALELELEQQPGPNASDAPLEDVIKEGTPLTIRQEAYVYDSIDSWDHLAVLQAGDPVIAAGVPQEYSGYMMVPIRFKDEIGAVALSCIQGQEGEGEEDVLDPEASEVRLPLPPPPPVVKPSRIAAFIDLVRRKVPQKEDRGSFEMLVKQNTLNGRNAYTAPVTNINECKRLCVMGGYGAFVVWQGVAYFKGQSTFECRQNLFDDNEAVTYLNLSRKASKERPWIKPDERGRIPTVETGENAEVDELLEFCKEDPEAGKRRIEVMLQSSLEALTVAKALADPRADSIFILSKDGTGEIDVMDLLQEQVVGVIQENIFEQAVRPANSRFFMVVYCFVVFMLWIGETMRKGLPWSTAKAGLETISKGSFDLRLYDDCQDTRFQIWRWWSYQLTHIGFQHIFLNAFLTIVLSIPAEGLHGIVRVFVMFNVGIFGGAMCAMMWTATRSPVVGMSGGVYALFGIHLGTLLINWRQRAYRWTTLFFIASLILIEMMFVQLDLVSDNSSSSTHFGGAISGLLIGIIVGKDEKEYRWERLFKAIVFLIGLGLVIFCAVFAFRWPPQSIRETVGYCWVRQAWNITHFGSDAWQCIRCGTQDCIDGWVQTQQFLKIVAIQVCNDVGWSNVTWSQPVGGTATSCALSARTAQEFRDCQRTVT